MAVIEAVIVDTIDELTPEWFTSALREGGTIPSGVAVVDVRSELIGTGQVGLVVRCELDYEGLADGEGPPSVVVKLPSAEEGNRQVGIAMGLYESEVRFYREIAPLVGAAIPRLHWADVAPQSGRITLVIDDLTGCAEAGDMIARATPEQAQLAFAQLVELQAPLWNDQKLRSLSWLADPLEHRCCSTRSRRQSSRSRKPTDSGSNPSTLSSCSDSGRRPRTGRRRRWSTRWS
jgi:hypothetical protein